MNLCATKETLKKVKDLQKSKQILINDKGEEARIAYILRVRPYGTDHVNAGDIVTVQTTDKNWVEYTYGGEEGLQELLKEWKTLKE